MLITYDPNCEEQNVTKYFNCLIHDHDMGDHKIIMFTICINMLILS